MADPSVPSRMHAVTVAGGRGGPEALVWTEVATPAPGLGEVLIRVAAAGINRPDILQRRGVYPPPAGVSEILGLEVAGEVVGVGATRDGATGRWAPGDPVCALLGGGGYAEYVTVDARHALPVPPGLDLVAAGALPETVFTVFANVFESGGLGPGETLLVHGATSGIGLTAIALARAAGARVIATGRSADKATAARRCGADVAVDTSAQDFVAVAQAQGGADVVLDMVGGDWTARNLAALKPGGRLVVIATQAGAVAQIDLIDVMRRRLTLTGSTLRSRDADEKARLARAIEARVWPWVASGAVRPVIDRTFAMADAGAAHAWLEAGGHVGKIVLTASDA